MEKIVDIPIFDLKNIIDKSDYIFIEQYKWIIGGTLTVQDIFNKVQLNNFNYNLITEIYLNILERLPFDFIFENLMNFAIQSKDENFIAYSLGSIRVIPADYIIVEPYMNDIMHILKTYQSPKILYYAINLMYKINKIHYAKMGNIFSKSIEIQEKNYEELFRSIKKFKYIDMELRKFSRLDPSKLQPKDLEGFAGLIISKATY